MPCVDTSCQGGLQCCVPIAYYPGFYCKVASQCYQQPLWQVIAIPCLLAFLTLAIVLLAWVKLRGKTASRRDVRAYAYEEM